VDPNILRFRNTGGGHWPPQALLAANGILPKPWAPVDQAATCGSASTWFNVFFSIPGLFWEDAFLILRCTSRLIKIKKNTHQPCKYIRACLSKKDVLEMHKWVRVQVFFLCVLQCLALKEETVRQGEVSF
jgi:hypothetical protein